MHDLSWKSHVADEAFAHGIAENCYRYSVVSSAPNVPGNRIAAQRRKADWGGGAGLLCTSATTTSEGVESATAANEYA